MKMFARVHTYITSDIGHYALATTTEGLVIVTVFSQYWATFWHQLRGRFNRKLATVHGLRNFVSIFQY